MKNLTIIASFIPVLAFADTSTIITPSGNYVITNTGATTYVTGANTGTVPIAITASSATHTYITPSGTYMAIPNGSSTTVLQVSGARK